MSDITAIRDFIFQRRSIRKYQNIQIPQEIVVFLLEAGMAAPSANNYQPWSFVVVKERSILDALAEVHPYGKMLFQAPLALVVVGDPTVSPQFWVQDCSAATENILLAAAGIGLGAVWLGVYPREERRIPLKHILQIPDKYKILSLLSLGYPAEKKEPRTQYQTEKVHFNTWQT
ncbi:nitroreductase family protein [candidate division CSSED10-310 bacterium]|uniref:Nitroreductase family protein n=1 Tax=candidate division CSSED10-310 bacterium TaxID=2855610 RepID=A0ABV6Z1S2_UNCC1